MTTPSRPSLAERLFVLATALFLAAWLPALFGWWAARVVYVLSAPVAAGLALFLAVRRSP